MRLDHIVDSSQDSLLPVEMRRVRKLMRNILAYSLCDLEKYRAGGGKKAVEDIRAKYDRQHSKLENSQKWSHKKRNQWAYRMAQYENQLLENANISEWWGFDEYSEEEKPVPGSNVSLDMIALTLDIPIESLRKLALKMTDPNREDKTPIRKLVAEFL